MFSECNENYESASEMSDIPSVEEGEKFDEMFTDMELSEHFILTPESWSRLQEMKKEAHEFARHSEDEWLLGLATPVDVTVRENNILNLSDLEIAQEARVVYGRAYQQRMAELIQDWKNR